MKGGTYFEDKSLHMYTRVVMDQGGVEVKNMIDLVLVKKSILCYVRTVREMGRGHSDHYVALCKVKLVGAWINRREVVDAIRRIRSEKLREHPYREGYARSLGGEREKKKIVLRICWSR